MKYPEWSFSQSRSHFMRICAFSFHVVTFNFLHGTLLEHAPFIAINDIIINLQLHVNLYLLVYVSHVVSNNAAVATFSPLFGGSPGFSCSSDSCGGPPSINGVYNSVSGVLTKQSSSSSSVA